MKIPRKLIAAILAIALLPAIPQMKAEASTGREELENIIAGQVGAYAESIDQPSADSAAGSAIVKHGLSGNGKKLIVDENHPLTATLMNANMPKTVVIKICSGLIDFMQSNGTDSATGVMHLLFYNDYYAYYYAMSELNVNDREYQKYFENKAFTDVNGYDETLEWIAGNMYAFVTVSRKNVDETEATYDIRVEFGDTFDFDTSADSVPKAIASLLGSIFFREFEWKATAEFEIKTPYSCNHKSGSYRWVYDYTARMLESDNTGGYIHNPAKTIEINPESGNTRYNYKFETPVILQHDKPWVMEYDLKGTETFIMSSDDISLYFPCFFHYFRSRAAFGQYMTSGEKDLEDYGAALFNYSTYSEFTFRYENIIAADGTNSVWMSVFRTEDGELVHGPFEMNGHYTQEGYQGTGNWISGKDFVIRFVGTVAGYTLGNCEFELRIFENGESAPEEDCFVSGWKNPTCAEEGGLAHTCTRCGYSYKTETVEKTAHNYKETVVAPTCDAEGYTLHECKGCGDSYITDKTAKLEHSYKQTVQKPTCTEKGYTLNVCKFCGENFRSDFTDMIPHSYVAEVIAPTCTKQGYTLYTCNAGCRKNYKDNYTEPTGHVEVIDEAVPRTCTETGLTEGSHCGNCGMVMVEQKVVTAAGHIVRTNKAVAPTCTKEGLTEGTFCWTCKEVFTGQEVIPAMGHIYDDEHDLECNVCGEKRAPEYIPGDSNGDGKITSRDATRILQYLIDSEGNIEIDLSAADYNGDGKVTSRDATAILRYLIGA